MAWKSTTFKKSTVSASKPVTDAISRAVAIHRDAMMGVISDAKKLAEKRQRTLDSIQDPELKRSAAR